ncbi:MAG: AMP-binding enzyme, partial [Burkholderiaceae bacterium]
ESCKLDLLRYRITGDEAMVETLQNFVKQQIAPFKYPRRIQFMPSLPRTETGKLQRFRLRQLSADH